MTTVFQEYIAEANAYIRSGKSDASFTKSEAIEIAQTQINLHRANDAEDVYARGVASRALRKIKASIKEEYEFEELYEILFY